MSTTTTTTSAATAGVAPKVMTAADGMAGMAVPDVYGREVLISWYRGELEAADEIIDMLCRHIVRISGGTAAEYDPVFAAIDRRRANWIPVLHKQKYFCIGEVAFHLRNIAEKRRMAGEVEEDRKEEKKKEKKKMAEGKFPPIIYTPSKSPQQQRQGHKQRQEQQKHQGGCFGW
jgi:hypothetical protein